MALLKKTKTSIPAFLVITVITLSIVGFSYAHWEKYMWMDVDVTTGTMCAEFVSPVTRTDHGLDWTCDEGFENVRQINKDIGNSNGTLVDTDGDGYNDTIEILLNNTYPCYYEHISFWIHNCGTIPWKIHNVTFNDVAVLYAKGYLRLDLNGDGYDDVEIYWGNNFGAQVDPCEKADLSFEIHVLQDAPPGTTMSLLIKITVINWNENQ